MRLIDFFVYFFTSFYNSGKRGGLLWESPLRRTVFLVGVTFGILLIAIFDIAVYFIYGTNLIGYAYSKVFVIVFVLIVIQLLRYVYIKKKRYEYIISDEYPPFLMNNALGIAICAGSVMLAFVVLILLVVLK